MKKRLLSVTLALCLIVSLLPTVALAAGKAALQTDSSISHGTKDPVVILTSD